MDLMIAGYVMFAAGAILGAVVAFLIAGARAQSGAPTTAGLRAGPVPAVPALRIVGNPVDALPYDWDRDAS